MTIVFAVLFLFALGLAIFLLVRNKRLEEEVLRVNNWAQTSVAEAQKSADERVDAFRQQDQRVLRPVERRGIFEQPVTICGVGEFRPRDELRRPLHWRIAGEDRHDDRVFAPEDLGQKRE